MPFRYLNNMDKVRVALVEWLNETLDLEYTAMNVFERHASFATNYADPELGNRIGVFISKGKEHAMAIGDEILELGGKVGATKAIPGVAKGAILSFIEGAPKDGEIHRIVDEWTLEQAIIIHLEMIIVAARTAGNSDTAMRMEAVLQEKRSMAAWFEEYAPLAIKDFMEKES
jgi:ferritin-like metal-binding protein YciE